MQWEPQPAQICPSTKNTLLEVKLSYECVCQSVSRSKRSGSYSSVLLIEHLFLYICMHECTSMYVCRYECIIIRRCIPMFCNAWVYFFMQFHLKILQSVDVDAGGTIRMIAGILKESFRCW